MEFKEILIKEIIPDPNQPRKFFDEHAMQELTASVMEKGVIQPILVRLKNKKLMLVCGERRLKAATSVMNAQKERNTIPAVIRELSDDEALELQIIENLQRKEVHPMEEAVAFKSLIDHGKDLKEIAAKVGKSEFYARQRVKLCALTEGWQKVFFSNRISISEVLKLVLFDPGVQNELLKEEGDQPEIKFSKWDLAKYMGNLSTAPFDLTDPNLNKKMGACTGCQFNSASAKLFQDADRQPTCSLIPCFKTKCDNHFIKELDDALAEPAMIFILGEYGNYSDKFTKKVEAAGFKVVDKHSYSEPYRPELPNYEEFKEEWLEDNVADEKAMSKSFEEEIKTYEKDLEEYNKKVAGGKFKKAYVISGDDRGKYVYVTIVNRGSSLKAPGSSAQTKEKEKEGTLNAQDITDEIERIRVREKRTKEIDEQKIWGELRTHFNPPVNAKMMIGEFSQVEREAIATALYNKIEYSGKSSFEKMFAPKTKFAKIDNETFQQVLRFFMLSILPPSILYSGYNDDAKLCLKVAHEYFPSVLKDIQDKQAEATKKRVGKVDKRITDLQQQRKDLNVAVKKPAAKKSAPKKKGEGVKALLK